jgi:ectoine hydroxylase-related dioxygenase (phytanoyl-CoA dioxygenase family)
MNTSHLSRFEKDGYCVIPQALGPEACADLLHEIIEAFHTSAPTVIKEPAYRRHAPLALSDAVSDALTTIVEHGHSLLSNFLQNEQELVELSSITVFPNAAEQPLHRDEANEGHFLVSVFINLVESCEQSGALQVIPGSHRLEEGGCGAPMALELLC